MRANLGTRIKFSSGTVIYEFFTARCPHAERDPRAPLGRAKFRRFGRSHITYSQVLGQAYVKHECADTNQTDRYDRPPRPHGAVPKGALIMQGAQPDTYKDVGDSGLPVLRRFCSKCGSPIFTEAAATPTIDWLKAGTLDDTSWLQPQVNIWCDSAQSWVQMSDAIPRIPRNPPPA